MNKVFAIALLCAVGACTPQPTPSVTDNAPVVPVKPPPMSVRRSYPLSGYAKTTISVKGHALDTYVADSPGEQEEGLMWLQGKELGTEQAMIFVFTDDEPRSFWMRNTLIPLDIAYLNASGVILNIRTMQPLDESSQPSEGKARYAVETHAGWFKSKRVAKGAKFNLGTL